MTLPATAQVADPLLRPAITAPDLIAESNVGFRSGNVVLAPIPFSNDTIGSGLTLGAGYLFSFPGSKPSGLGVGYMKTSNGTEGYGFGGNVNFGDGRWTIGAVAGDADINYDLPLSESLALPLTQSARLVAGRLEYGITPTIKAGLALTYLQSDIRFDSTLISSLPDFLQPDLEVDLSRLTFDVVRDTRDDTFYPTDGSLASFEYFYGHVEDSVFNNTVSISDRNYNKILVSGSVFQAVGSGGVLAGNAVVCGAESAAPFFDSCGVGFVDSVRGFETLGNLGNWSASAQVEYRGRLSKRLGYVGFVGFGGSGEEFWQISSNNGGVAVGAGLRYRISLQFPLDYSADYAINDDGEGFLYLTIGQRF